MKQQKSPDEKIKVLKRVIDVLDLIANTSGGVKHTEISQAHSGL